MVLASGRANPWEYHPHPDVWLVVGLLVVGYVVALRRLGPGLVADGAPVATRRQRWQFGIGGLLILGFAEWPVHDLAEDYLFTVHMVQHTVFSLVATPLLLLGTPRWLLSWLIGPILPMARRLVRPLPATLLFNTVIVVSHAAFWVNYTVQHEWAHLLAHTLLVVTAAVMWLPVVHRLPELPQMSPPVRMLYLFLQSVVPNVPGAFLTFAERPIYAWYAAAPRITGLSAVQDQQTAGAIMKVGGTLIIWSAIVVLFFRWYQESERQSGDTLTWEDVEREFERTQPARPS